MKRVITLAIAVAWSSLAHGASEPDLREKDACASLTRIGGLRALDNRTAIVMSSTGQPAYLVKLGVPLPALKFAHRYAYIDRDRDGRLCGRSRDGIALPNDTVRAPATILSMSRLESADIDALEAKYGVRLRPRSKRHEAGSIQQNVLERADNG